MVRNFIWPQLNNYIYREVNENSLLFYLISYRYYQLRKNINNIYIKSKDWK
jgi:hypothetical protein